MESNIRLDYKQYIMQYLNMMERKGHLGAINNKWTLEPCSLWAVYLFLHLLTSSSVCALFGLDMHAYSYHVIFIYQNWHLRPEEQLTKCCENTEIEQKMLVLHRPYRHLSDKDKFRFNILLFVLQREANSEKQWLVEQTQPRI